MRVKDCITILLMTVVLLVVYSFLTLIGNEPASVSSAAAERISQTSATVSGTIRHNGTPIAGITVILNWGGNVIELTTNASGFYSYTSSSIGQSLNIHVRPPISDRLAFRNWGIDQVTSDLVKNFDLESGYRLQGEFRQPDNSPYFQSFWLGTDPISFSPPEGEWIGDGAENGQFDLIVRPGIYTINPDPHPYPYYMPRTKVDLSSSDLTGLVVTLIEKLPPPFPIKPPDTSLITVGDPDVEGYATVTGASGAVEPLSAVMVVNLSARTPTITTADASGGFSTTLYAPIGSSLLIKYDPVGDRVAQLWQDAQSVDNLPVPTYTNPLPGTILYVGAPLADSEMSQAFSSVGSFYTESPTSWAGWVLSGTLQTLHGESVQPGQEVTLHAQLRVTSPALNCSGAPAFTPSADIRLRYLFGSDGHSEPWGMWFNAHLFTPTGLPIEHEADGEVRGVFQSDFTALTCVSDHAFDGLLETTFTIPADLPDGVYMPEVYLHSGGVPLDEDVPLVPVWYHFDPIASLPPLTIGSPAAPHIPWTLLGDYPINGHRGVLAREDTEHFVMPTRIVFPPHQVVLPRLDERSGDPLVYRLEPGSHWLSASERRLPNPPHIPLAFPSGSLTVQVQKPDGSTDVLGPAVIRQSSVRTPTTPGGVDLDGGTGQVSDLYHLTTMDNAFSYSFEQYGSHVITLSGEVNDIYGNSYAIKGTYDVIVARILDLDPAQLPSTPYEQGDVFAPGLHIFPPYPADVKVKIIHTPYSDPNKAETTTLFGQANRFGYFQPSVDTAIKLTTPGEFRVDLTATYTETDGTLWMGTMTWGNVVEGSNTQIEAHGRRGMDYTDSTIDDMPAWFEVFNLPPDKVGIEVYYPYFSGDVHWGNEDRQPGDSIHSIITIKDLTGINETIYNIIRNQFSKARNCFRNPPDGCSQSGLENRIAIGEAPLFITTKSGIDPAVDPDDIDMWGYWYGSSERPDVRVREIISEDGMGTAYWRFDDTYGYQIGEGAAGDLPGDLKWEFGGAVFRLLSETNSINEYAIYSSLWVLLPHNDPIGARVTPPFQDATGASLNGGAIMTLLGEEIDMLFLPKGVRPGDILEVGDVIAFSGHVGPPLDSRVSVTITAPSGATKTRTWHANKIGWIYDPSFDFVANEVGRWTVDVSVLHDRPYVGNGITPANHNSGTVLGTNGQYDFYVVQPNSPNLSVTEPQPGYINWSSGGVEPIHIRGSAPADTDAIHYTIHDKGVVMGQGNVTPDSSGNFTLTYDAKALNEKFPFLSLTAREGMWEGLADEVAINLFADGSQPQANTVTLIGEEVFLGNILHQVLLPLVMNP